MLAEIDISILRYIHHNRLVEADMFLYYVSKFTSYISIGAVLSILVISLVTKSQTLRLHFFRMVAVLVIAALTSFTLKNLIPRDRPFVTHPDIVKLSQAGSSSFPSGHTIEAFAIATGLALLFRKKSVVIPAYIWAVTVAYSRMALGVHYPTDVLAGMIIGSLTGWLVIHFLPFGYKKIKNN